MKVKCLVPISGGRDSQACLRLAVDHFDRSEILGLFCDTQYEHPKTYAHIAWMSEYYGVEIRTITAGDVLQKSARYGRFPGGDARHCTDELKIVPTKKFCKALAEQQGEGFEVWYGMRTQESAARAKRYDGKLTGELYPSHLVMPSKYPKYLHKLGVSFRLCVVDWSEEQVTECVGWENLNPLYHAGFPRVGCFPCLASGDKWNEKAFQHDEFGAGQLIRTRQVADAIGKDIFTSKGGKLREVEALERDNPGCLICSM